MSCNCCDSDSHPDVPGAIAAASARAKTLLGIQLGIAIIVTIAALIAMPVGSWLLPAGWGLGTWAAATGVGAMVGTWARAGRDIGQSSVAMRVNIYSSAAAAIVLVFGALIAGGQSDGRYVGGTADANLSIWQLALAVVSGWLIGAGLIAVVQTYGWLRIMRTPGDAGELVRTGIVHTALPSLARSLVSYLVPAIMLGVWIVAIAWLVWMVLIALPTQVLVGFAFLRQGR
ncbi:MAG: hypothetical protein Q4Q03_04860 [Bowdeniella nasicola]|nr:hypothetical protein [Bowdeniella nasicola]